MHGVVESECVESIEHPVELQTVAGHESVTQTALMDADVTQGSRGRSTPSISEHRPAASAFVPDGRDARFPLAPVPDWRGDGPRREPWK